RLPYQTKLRQPEVYPEPAGVRKCARGLFKDSQGRFECSVPQEFYAQSQTILFLVRSQSDRCLIPVRRIQAVAPRFLNIADQVFESRRVTQRLRPFSALKRRIRLARL